DRSPIADDFKIETHPRGGKPVQYFTYETYTPSNPQANPSLPQQHNNGQRKPWAPFVKRLDFEVAEFMRDAGLNRRQMNCLLTLINNVRQQPKEFTLVDAKHVREMWKIAAEQCNVGLKPVKVEAEYKDEAIEYMVWASDLWESWALQLLKDPVYIHKMHWDA
ncbi:hypothetical protein BKA70DRAFT_1032984, partial [Coprinopsis sp. MPI-PUGE-AT-0042]